MSPKKRAEAIESFQRDPSTTVFLLSVRAGACGINLTAASHVYLMEPAMNPAMEEQAIGRAWRMGQQRAVTVKRLFVKVGRFRTILALVSAAFPLFGAMSSACSSGWGGSCFVAGRGCGG